MITLLGLRALGVTPHVAQHITHRRSAIDGRTTRHGGYEVSQGKRKLVEEIFGRAKTIALLRKTRYRGVGRVGWIFTFALAVYNLVADAEPDLGASGPVMRPKPSGRRRPGP